MATIEQRTFFRDKVGDTGTPPAFSDDEVDGIYAVLASSFPSATGLEYGLRAVLYGIDVLLINATKLVDYKQNQSSESQSDIFSNLLKLRDVYAGELGTEVALNANSNASWGAIGGGNPRRGFGRPLNEPLYGDLSRNRRIW